MKLEPELLHIAALFNPEVYKQSATIIQDFPWSTAVGKQLFTEARPLDQFNEVTISSMLSEIMIPDEVEGFISVVQEMKSVTNTKEIDELSKAIFKHYKVRKVHEVVAGNSDNIDLLVTNIKKIPETIGANIEIFTLGKLIPSEVIESELGSITNVIPSNFNIIKTSTPFNGYLPGQVVQVVGAPGRGKSAFMLYEIALMAISGYRILWIAMGDLMKYDFITRFTTVVSGTEYYKVALNPDKYFTEDVKEVADRIDLITIPAGKLSTKDLINIVDNSPYDYDVVVADYDSNFKVEGENSYNQGGDTYNDLTEIARPPGKKARLVFIASQPKVHYWEELRIPLEGAGESSRKQHIVDIMITMGTANADRPAGIMFLPKVRRGSPGQEIGYMMDEAGRFHEISKEQLALMRRF